MLAPRILYKKKDVTLLIISIETTNYDNRHSNLLNKQGNRKSS